MDVLDNLRRFKKDADVAIPIIMNPKEFLDRFVERQRRTEDMLRQTGIGEVGREYMGQ